MVCKCGHVKKDHETGLDYGRNGWKCTKCSCHSYYYKAEYERDRAK